MHRRAHVEVEGEVGVKAVLAVAAMALAATVEEVPAAVVPKVVAKEAAVAVAMGTCPRYSSYLPSTCAGSSRYCTVYRM